MRSRKRYSKAIILLTCLLLVWMTGCGSISDGEYAASVTLTGGSGKAHIESPCTVTVNDNKATAHIIWSSKNYDFMIVNGEKYYPINNRDENEGRTKKNPEGNSEFEIPVVIGKDMDIQADTVAMSQPHLIDYTIRFDLTKTDAEADSNIENDNNSLEAKNINVSNPPIIDGLEYVSTDENIYAKCFAVHRYEGGYVVISVDDGRNYLLVPNGAELPKDIKVNKGGIKALADTGNELIIIKKPERLYLAASGVMCQLDAIGEVSSIKLSGIERDKWYIDAAKKAMDEGTMQYGGKYSAPDYEKMIEENIDLAVENTMILHSPKVVEKLEEIGIPTIIDRSSYEENPLGRCEWVKVYGVLMDKEKEADAAFETQRNIVENLDGKYFNGKTVALFSINSNHMIVTRKKNDYYAKMIEMAGGTYLSPETNEDDSTSAQITISMESFYEYASLADVLIINTAIEDIPESIGKLTDTDAIFADFKGIQSGEVYYTDKSLYQYSDKSGTIISNLNEILSGKTDDTEFFHKLPKDKN